METKRIIQPVILRTLHLEMFLFFRKLFLLENAKVLLSFSIVEYILYVIIEIELEFLTIIYLTTYFLKLPSPKHNTSIMLSSSWVVSWQIHSYSYTQHKPKFPIIKINKSHLNIPSKFLRESRVSLLSVYSEWKVKLAASQCNSRFGPMNLLTVGILQNKSTYVYTDTHANIYAYMARYMGYTKRVAWVETKVQSLYSRPLIGFACFSGSTAKLSTICCWQCWWGGPFGERGSD